MGDHFVRNEVVVTRQQNFTHGIAGVAKILEGAFDAKVVKTVGNRLFAVVFDGIGGIKRLGTILLNYLMALLEKLKSDLAA